FGSAAAELVGKRLVSGRKIEADRVNAVALARRRRAVRENMTLMRPATGAYDLRPDHAVARVADIFQVISRERLGEARPAGPALELGAAVEKRQAAKAAGEGAGPLLVQEHAAERSFGAMLE